MEAQTAVSQKPLFFTNQRSIKVHSKINEGRMATSRNPLFSTEEELYSNSKGLTI